ncbi:MAG: NAD(P)-dependent oxidoreductase [Pirellulaceae bacterium]
MLTGARGQAGQAVIDMALKTNRRVKAIARSRRFPFADRIELLTADLRQLARYAPFLEDVEGFIHLAAARKNTLRDDVFEDLRILATLLKHWHQGNFIFASSQIVYSLGNLPHKEESPCSPVGWYAAGKLMSEQLIQAHFNTCTAAWKLNHQWVSFRIPPVFIEAKPVRSSSSTLTFGLLAKEEHFTGNARKEQARAVGSSWVGERDLANALLDSLAIERVGFSMSTRDICGGLI